MSGTVLSFFFTVLTHFIISTNTINNCYCYEEIEEQRVREIVQSHTAGETPFWTQESEANEQLINSTAMMMSILILTTTF